MAPMGVPWPSRGVPWPLYEDHALELSYYIYSYLFGGWDRGALLHLLGAPCINYLTYLLTYLLTY